MSGDAIGGLSILLFCLAIIVAALRDKKSRDANGCIRRFSAAWWVILFFVPFGFIWCVVRIFIAGDPNPGEPGSPIQDEAQEPQEGVK
jgi:hypothetical protein